MRYVQQIPDILQKELKKLRLSYKTGIPLEVCNDKNEKKKHLIWEMY